MTLPEASEFSVQIPDNTAELFEAANCQFVPEEADLHDIVKALVNYRWLTACQAVFQQERNQSGSDTFIKEMTAIADSYEIAAKNTDRLLSSRRFLQGSGLVSVMTAYEERCDRPDDTLRKSTTDLFACKLPSLQRDLYLLASLIRDVINEEPSTRKKKKGRPSHSVINNLVGELAVIWKGRFGNWPNISGAGPFPRFVATAIQLLPHGERPGKQVSIPDRITATLKRIA